MSQRLSGKCLALIDPTERLGHGAIKVIDKRQHFRLEISDRGKSATFEQLTSQNAEPKLNLVHPGSVCRRIVKDNAMGRIRQESGAALHRGENAGLAFDAQSDVQVRLLGDVADQGFRLMCVEIVDDEVPLHDLRICLDGALDMSEKIFFRARRISRHLPDFAIRHMEVDDERQRAMADVLKLAMQHMPWLHGQVGVFRFQGLDTGHFIGAHNRFSTCSAFLRRLIQMIDVRDFLVRLRIGFGIQPITHQVWLKPPFFSSRAAWRAEMRSTMPRFINSSAISRPVHWLIGRPAFSSASHANCSIWQIWSAVIRGGVPGRGKSSSRSATLRSSQAIGSSSCHRRPYGSKTNLRVNEGQAASR